MSSLIIFVHVLVGGVASCYCAVLCCAVVISPPVSHLWCFLGFVCIYMCVCVSLLTVLSGLYRSVLFDNCGRMCRPVMHLPTGRLEWIGPLEQQFMEVRAKSS